MSFYSSTPLNVTTASLLIIGTLVILTMTQLDIYQSFSVTGSSSSSNSSSSSILKTILNSNHSDSDESHLNFKLTPLPTYRLPTTLSPWLYQLKIRPIVPPPMLNDTFHIPSSPNVTYFTVPGRVTIWFHCVRPTDRITVNLNKILVNVHEDSVKVFRRKLKNVNTDSLPTESTTDYSNDNDLDLDLGDNDLDQIPVIGHEYEGIQEFYTIFLGQTLQPENDQIASYGLTIQFTSTLIQYRSMGIFVNAYRDPIQKSTKQSSWIVSTQFQPSFARSAFPCFDEPGFKSIFEITVGRRGDHHSLSNAMLKETIEDPDHEGWYWDKFEPTLKMSVYLVCVAVSNFVSEDRVADNGKPIKVWAPRHQIEKGAGSLAANLTSEFVTYFENLFNMTDPIPKVDSIVIPHFTSSGMENYGLITYAEHYLMYIPNLHPQIRRRLITMVVAHELSHFYFGNIVTCDWWSDVWLNEGFATYLSFMAIEELHPDLEVHDQFVSDIIQGSMRYDAELSTNPVKMSSVRNRSDIENAFGRSSYRKGGSMVRMLKFILGEPSLIEGMRKFLKKFAFQSANQDDLFKVFDEVGHHRLPTNYGPVVTSVHSIMTPWTTQSSYPLVRVSVVGRGQIQFTQEPVTRSRSAPHDRGSLSWWIPLWISTADQSKESKNEINYWPLPDLWIPHNVSIVLYPKDYLNTSQWIIVNPNYEAYIAVLYDPHLSNLIKEQLTKDHKVFSRAFRTQILFDYVHFWECGYIPLESFLDLTLYLGKERDFIVWNTLFPLFWDLHRKISGNQRLHQLFRKYLAPRLDSVLDTPKLKKLKGNVTIDKDTDSLFKGELMTLGCYVDTSACQNYSVEILKKMAQDLISSINSTTVDSSMKHITMSVWACAVVRRGGEVGWEFMNNHFNLLVTHFGENWSLFGALTCATDEDLIERSFDLVTNSSLSPHQLANVDPNALAMDLLFNFLLDNYELDPKFLGTSSYLIGAIETMSLYMYKMEDVERLQLFIETNKNWMDQGEIWSLKGAVWLMTQNNVWMNVHGLALTNWLANNI